jgi:co-chaperonin GroES (HSP10)
MDGTEMQVGQLESALQHQMGQLSAGLQNPSGLKPLGRAVLVKPYEPPKRGMIELPESVQERHIMLEVRAIVVEVGPHAWPDEPARCKPGDKVLVAKMNGFTAKGPLDGLTYRLLNDRDIFCGVVEFDDTEVPSV